MADRIGGKFCGGKNVLPNEFASRVGIFSFEGERQVDPAGTASRILPMQFFHARNQCA